ncbi:MAG: YtxH domain-containing protein [Ferruginibacter sp.]|nr:YtxH domain-containing protein [Chitinophagaceae bacterium]
MSKVLLGFVAGAAVGALAGILFAPDSGTNTRKKIAHKAGDWTDAAKESFNGLIDGVKKAYSGAQDEAEEFGDKAKAKMTSAKNDVKSEVRNAMS